MLTPNTITEWIDERVGFIENILSATSEINDKNEMQTFDSIVLLKNFRYCKKLHFMLLKDCTNKEIKMRFRNIANKLIFDTFYELDKQEYQCIHIHQICFPTKEKDILPQENIDNIAQIRVALENIFNEVQILCRT
jgi:hypothetical protein